MRDIRTHHDVLINLLEKLNEQQASRIMNFEAKEKIIESLELKLSNQRDEIIRLMGLLQEEHLRVKQYQDWHWEDVIQEIKTNRKYEAMKRSSEWTYGCYERLCHAFHTLGWEKDERFKEIELKKRDNDMTNAEVDTDKVVQLNSHAGGKDNGGNWLINLPEGTVFLTREKKPDTVTCVQFHLKMKWNRAVLLHSNFPHGTFDEFFDSENFCKKYDLIDIQQTGTTSDNLDARPRNMENHVNDVSESEVL